MTDLDIITKTLEKNCIVLSKEQINKFNEYYALLIEYNKKFNLTSLTDIKDVALKHFVDSILPVKVFNKNASILDIGSGAGFPGIPLSIIRPDLKITLLDSLNKRVNFLNTVINKLNLNNIIAVHSRAQEFCTQEKRSTYNYTTARAVSQLNILIELAIPFTKINGYFVGYKSINLENEISLAQNALQKLHSTIDNIYNFNLINLNNEKIKRNVITIKKLKATDNKYPRLKNLIKTNPL